MLFGNLARVSFTASKLVLTRSSMLANPLAQQIRGMKVRSAVKKLCSGCASVRRKGKVDFIKFLTLIVLISARYILFARKTKSTSRGKDKECTIQQNWQSNCFKLQSDMKKHVVQ